jgi:hypothetical protein
MGVHRRGEQGAVPENFGDLRERGSATDHLRGQSVPKQMRGTPSGALDTGSSKCRSNDMSHRCRTREAHMRWIYALEDSARFILASAGEVLGQCLADLGQQRQRFNQAALAVNHDLPAPPAQIIQFEPNDLAGSQPESGEQQENGIVPASGDGRSVCGSQDPIGLLR